MREKIRTAIDEALTADPDNETLKRQAAFVFHAQITTIDAFCNHVLKDHFHRVGAEPDFRIGDARELSILSKEVMDELMQTLKMIMPPLYSGTMQKIRAKTQ
jgi:ATP-dependent helicase/nuclease subunit A